MRAFKPQHKTYKTQRLVLRPIEFDDYEAWIRCQDLMLPQQDQFDIAPAPLQRRGKKSFRATVFRQRRTAKKDLAYIWQVVSKKTGELMGWIDVATILREPSQMANLGYCIHNNYRRKGYAIEALHAIIPGAFSDLGFHRLEASIDLDNRASIQLAKKCGLYREGIKKHYWFQNGRWEDQIVFIATPELFKKSNHQR